MLDQLPGISLIIFLKIFQIINYSGTVCIQICYLNTQYTYNLNLIFLIFNLLS